MSIWRPELNREKYKQAILFLLNGSANNIQLGKVKLFKLLYYVDFDHYQSYEAPVTGDTYRKLDYGPVPSHAQEIIDEMEADGLVEVSQRQVGNYLQNTFLALAKHDTNKFTATEMEILGQVEKKWAAHTRSEIVAATHGEAPWRAVGMGDEIPYSLAFYRRQDPEAIEAADEEPQELPLAS